MRNVIKSHKHSAGLYRKLKIFDTTWSINRLIIGAKEKQQVVQ